MTFLITASQERGGDGFTERHKVTTSWFVDGDEPKLGSFVQKPGTGKKARPYFVETVQETSTGYSEGTRP